VVDLTELLAASLSKRKPANASAPAALRRVAAVRKLATKATAKKRE